MTPNWFVAWPAIGAEAWLTELGRTAPVGLRVLPAEDLHVTLAFLGKFEPTQVKKLASLLRGLPLREIEVAPDRLVALPQPRRFSALAFTLSAGRLEVEGQITKWRDRICRDMGGAIETRAALPHVTIARPERRITDADRDEAIAWAEAMPRPDVRLQLTRPRIYTWAEPGAESRYRILD